MPSKKGKKSSRKSSGSSAKIRNPRTGRFMNIGGPTHLKLKKTHPLHFEELEKQIAAMHGRMPGKGNSNAVKHAREGLAASDFCGPEGGAAATAFPVNTPGRRRAALAYARDAPNPRGIRDCVRRKREQLGVSV